MSTKPEIKHQEDIRVIKKLEMSERDHMTIEHIQVDPEMVANDFFDYSKVVVKKPWGYEYLIFQNETTAVWVLWIKKDYQTSFHCHPNKKTSITVLCGEVICSTLEENVQRSAAYSMLAGKGVFHRTKAISEEGAYVMEVETPVNKRDLVRFLDDYGREKMGYEKIDQMSFNVSNYNYTSFIDPKVYYNVKKRFGCMSIDLARFKTDKDLHQLLQSMRWDNLCVLKGKIINTKKKIMFDVGDILTRQDFDVQGDLCIAQEVEAIIIQKTDTMVRVSDFIVSHLGSKNLKHFFFVPGASNAHLIDAIGRDTDIFSVALQTENAVTLAAEAYSKLTGKNGIAVVSSGASSVNAMTGVANSWIDSAPLMVISGQSRSTELGSPNEKLLRQLVNKELDVAGLVKTITKYSSIVHNSVHIKEELDRALYHSQQGRSGPVWLDIPIDILGMNIDEAELTPFSEYPVPPAKEEELLKKNLPQLMDWLGQSKRPVILAGFGIRASKAEKEFIELAKKLNIPILTSRRGADLVAEDFPLYFGRPGTYGQRAANFIIQNSDLLISIGSRLSLPLIGRHYKAFARAAKKVVVDIDAQELNKITVPVDLAIPVSAGKFIQGLEEVIQDHEFSYSDWIARCRSWKEKFPPSREYAVSVKTEDVNPYYFVEKLSEYLESQDVLVVDGGPSLDYVMQTFKVKTGQRIISSPGLELQGFAIPGGIGACVGSNGRRIISLCEKKGLQLGMAELQTIANYHIPIKAFIFNTKENIAVQQMQKAYFGGRHVGSDSQGIVGSLDVAKLAEAYKIKSEVIKDHKHVAQKIQEVLSMKGPVLCEVTLPQGQEIIPRLIFTVTQDGRWISKPLEDMYPFLDREELKENMIIDLDEEEEL